MIIDTHTHLASPEWYELLRSHGLPRFEIKPLGEGKQAIFANGHVFGLLHPNLFERDKRIEDMDEAGVNMSVLSLTAPGVLFGGEDISVHAARISNDYLAGAQDAHPDRVRWIATLPMQYPDASITELKRAMANGARGVLICANVDGIPLTAPSFATLWAEMDRLETVVTIHPTLPAGAEAMTMEDYHLTAMVGFTFDTSLAVVRMIYDGFFDRYPNIEFIITHSGGTVPYITNRLDNGYRILPKCSENISQPPSAFLNRLYYDDAMARDDAATLCMGVCGADHYIHGSDYPFIPYARSLEWATDLEPAVRDAVMGGNAKALYGI